jgi:hypothetical protein
MKMFVENRPKLFVVEQWRSAFTRAPLVLGVRVAALLAVYVVLQSWLRQSAHLTANEYELPILTPSLLGRLFLSPVAILLGVAALRFRYLFRSWSSLESGQVMRMVAGGLIGMNVWMFAGYDFNYYYDQAHLLDRLLLVILGVSALWRPAFILPFLWLTFALAWQFDYPLQWQFSWTALDMPLRELTLIGAAFVVYVITAHWRVSEVMLLGVSLFASSYFWSGIGKLLLGWWAHPFIHLLLPAGYAHGWVSSIAPATVGALTEFLARFSLPNMAFTLMVELGALFALWHRRLTLAWLVGCICLHTGIVLVSGIAFWMWITLAALFILGVRRIGQLGPNVLYSRGSLALSILLIGGGPLWFRPVSLAWYDTPVTYTYRLIGYGASGSAYILPSRMFSLYSDMLTFGNFGYLDPEPRIHNLVWGVTLDRATADALVRVNTPEQLAEAERRFGQIEFQPERAQLFDVFVSRFIGNYNRRFHDTTAWPSLQAPGHLLSVKRPPVYEGQEPIASVAVIRITWLFADRQVQTVRELVVRHISLPDTQQSAGEETQR